MFQSTRGGPNYSPWNNPKTPYSVSSAPCVCMKSWHNLDHSKPTDQLGSKKGTPHNLKTTAVRDFLAKNPKPAPTLGEAIDETTKAYGDHHECLQAPTSKEKKEEALECLKIILLAYLEQVATPVDNGDGTSRQPTQAELLKTPMRS